MTSEEYCRSGGDPLQVIHDLQTRNAELCFLLGVVLGEIHHARGTLQGTISGETLDRIQKMIYPQKGGHK